MRSNKPQGLYRLERPTLISKHLFSTLLLSALFESTSTNGVDHILIKKFSRLGVQIFFLLWGSGAMLPNAQ